MTITDEELEIIHRARRMLRFIYLQGHTPTLDALEYDEVIDVMRELDSVAFRLTEKQRPRTRDTAVIDRAAEVLSKAGQTLRPLDVAALAQHAREAEDVCSVCGGRAVDGRCNNGYCG